MPEEEERRILVVGGHS